MQHGKPRRWLRCDQRDAREGQARSVGVADGFVVPMKPGNAGGGKEPWFEEDAGRGPSGRLRCVAVLTFRPAASRTMTTELLAV